MGPAIYLVSTLTSLACAILLLRGYVRVRKGLLLWSGLCFVGLTLSNFLVYVDLVLVPEVSLYRWRLATAAIAMLLLLYGLIWKVE